MNEVERLRKDAERYRYIREGGHWIVAATQTGVHLDGEELDDLIDGEIADAMPAAQPQVPEGHKLVPVEPPQKGYQPIGAKPSNPPKRK